MLDPLTAAMFADTLDDFPPVSLQYGVVTQTVPSLLVKVGAGTVGLACRRLATYTPTNGHFVAVLVAGADRVCLGNVT